MSSTDPMRIVRAGYDRLDGTYRDWAARIESGPRRSFVAGLLRLIPRGARVLEIGCGPGTDAPALSEGRRYTGIDLSEVQLRHARALAPTATFVLADALDVDWRPGSFDAVVAIHVFNHIPAARMTELFERIAAWLQTGGWLFASFGVSDDPGTVETGWLGAADMYFSSLPPEMTDASLADAGFSIRSDETLTQLEEDEGPATFRWVMAQCVERAVP